MLAGASNRTTGLHALAETSRVRAIPMQYLLIARRCTPRDARTVCPRERGSPDFTSTRACSELSRRTGPPGRRTDTFASIWSEPNVSCQSCHGPGERHVNWAQARAQGAATPALPPGQPTGLTVDFKGAGAKGQVDFCAACQSRRTDLTATPVPGQPRLDHSLPSLLAAGLYHPDGQ